MKKPLPHLAASTWMRAAALMLLALVIYWPCLNGPFVFDDLAWTTNLEWALQSLDGLRQFWFVPGVTQQYYPLTATTFWIDYQLWGMKTLPYHLENVLLHGLSAVLFWRLLRQLGVRGAYFAAALFVAHPMMVESVAWVTERKNVLCQVLTLAACLAYGHSMSGWSASARSRSSYWAALGLFIAAVLAKITAFVFPAALLVIAWWKHGRVEWRRDVLPVLPMFLIAMIACLGVAWMEAHFLGATGSKFEMAFSTRLMLSGQVLWFYLGKLLWPHPICVIYYRWTLDPSTWWQWSGTAAYLVTAVVLAWKNLGGHWRGVTAAALLFGGMLFPLLGFLDVAGMHYSWVADRWAYMPALAVFAVLGHGWACAPFFSPSLRTSLAAMLVSACGVLSWKQAATYASEDGFWQAAIAGNPSPWKARTDYADALMTAGHLEEAVGQLMQASEENPAAAAVHRNLGVVLHKQGKYADAMAEHQRALELDPESESLAHSNMALTFQEMGRPAEMEKAWLKVIELSPDYLPAHIMLGSYYFKNQQEDAAERHYRKAISLRPGNAHLLSSLASVLAWTNRPQEAIDLFKQVITIDPGHTTALTNYAYTVITTQDPSLRDIPLGIKLAERAVQSSGSKDANALIILAAAHGKAGHFLEAAEAARTASRAAEQQGNAELAAKLRLDAADYAAGKVNP